MMMSVQDRNYQKGLRAGVGDDKAGAYAVAGSGVVPVGVVWMALLLSQYS